MSILQLSYSRCFRLMVIAIFAGLFVDACNIADMFIGGTFDVRHDDSYASADLHVPPPTPSHERSSELSLSGMGSTARVQVVYDEDSPLTDIRYYASSLSAPLLVSESRIQLQSPFVDDQLYLRNSTLLI